MVNLSDHINITESTAEPPVFSSSCSYVFSYIFTLLVLIHKENERLFTVNSNIIIMSLSYLR